jgi:hypothetical protein
MTTENLDGYEKLVAAIIIKMKTVDSMTVAELKAELEAIKNSKILSDENWEKVFAIEAVLRSLNALVCAEYNE